MCDCTKSIRCPSCNAVIENKWIVVKSEKSPEKPPAPISKGVSIKKKSMPAVAPVAKKEVVPVVSAPVNQAPEVPIYLLKIARNWASSKLPRDWDNMHWVTKELYIKKNEDYDLIHYLLKTDPVRALKIACSKRLDEISKKSIELARMKEVAAVTTKKEIKPYSPNSTAPSKLKTVTDCDRRSILIAMLGEWKKISKQDLAKKLGLNLNQVMSVCAWTQKTLGDVDYLVKYVPEWLGSNISIDALLEKEFNN